MMLAGAKILREQHASMLDAMVCDHERATGQWQVEWHALPTAFIVASGALKSARDAMAGLDVRTSAMRANLNETGGLIVAEAVMMGLAPKLGRQRAHDAVYDCCRDSLETGRSFLSTLAENEVDLHRRHARGAGGASGSEQLHRRRPGNGVALLARSCLLRDVLGRIFRIFRILAIEGL